MLLVLEIFSWSLEDPKTTSSFALQFCQENSGLSYLYTQCKICHLCCFVSLQKG